MKQSHEYAQHADVLGCATTMTMVLSRASTNWCKSCAFRLVVTLPEKVTRNLQRSRGLRMNMYFWLWRMMNQLVLMCTGFTLAASSRKNGKKYESCNEGNQEKLKLMKKKGNPEKEIWK